MTNAARYMRALCLTVPEACTYNEITFAQNKSRRRGDWHVFQLRVLS